MLNSDNWVLNVIHPNVPLSDTERSVVSGGLCRGNNGNKWSTQRMDGAAFTTHSEVESNQARHSTTSLAFTVISRAFCQTYTYTQHRIQTRAIYLEYEHSFSPESRSFSFHPRIFFITFTKKTFHPGRKKWRYILFWNPSSNNKDKLCLVTLLGVTTVSKSRHLPHFHR